MTRTKAKPRVGTDDRTFINDLHTTNALKKVQNPELAPNFVTFMQHSPRKGVSKANSRQIRVEPWTKAAMVKHVSGEIPGRGRVDGAICKPLTPWKYRE